MLKYLYIIVAAIIAIGLGMIMRGYSVDVVEELRGGRGGIGRRFGRHGGFGHGGFGHRGYYGGYGGRGGIGRYGGYGGRSVNYVPIFWGDYKNYYYPEDQYYYYVGDPRPVPQVVSEYPFHQLFA
jgi:hypothetical protein